MTTTDFSLLLSIAFVHAVALISPGPDFVMIMKTSLNQGKLYARWSALGLALGVLVHVTYCLFGLSLLIHQYPYFLKIIAYVGASYLSYQGVLSILSAVRLKSSNTPERVADKKVPDERRQAKSLFLALSHGFATNLLNPKAIAYFVSFFASAVSQFSHFHIALVAGTEVFLLTWVWFTLVASLLTKPRIYQALIHNERRLQFIIGIVFLGFSLSMIIFTHT